MASSRRLLASLLLVAACGDDTMSPAEGSSTTSTPSSSTTTSPGTDTQAADDTTTTGLATDDSSEASDSTATGCIPAAGDPVAEDTMLQASDGTALAATITRPAEGSCLPAVLLVHQFTMSRAQWAPVTAAFIEAGYVTLALDLRGHGDSDPQQGALSDLLTDPDQAPLDVAAGIQWLAGLDQVDPARVGVVGTSIGANLSVVALHQGLVDTAVPISTRLTPTLSLAGMPASLSITNVLCWATDGDGMGEHADTCGQLAAEATGEARSEIIEGSSAHGVAIVDGFPEVIPQTIEWLDQTL